MTCVACTMTDHDACVATTPICGSDHTCRACSAHTDCPSSACLPDGACGDDTNVAYVDPMGTDNASCVKGTPCTRLDKALATNRTYVKFHGRTNGQVTINRDVTLLADPGAQFSDMSNGILIRIEGASKVAIYDLEITGASGNNNAGISLQPGNTATVSLIRAKVTENFGGGIAASGGTLTVTQSTLSNNAGGGVIASSGSTVTVTESTLSNNAGGGVVGTAGSTLTITESTVSGNTGGGILATGGTLTVNRSTISNNNPGGGISAMSGIFVIVGNVFFNNGGNASPIGGVVVSTSTNAANRLEFNSFNKNATQDGLGPAINCAAGTFTAKNNIMSNNGTQTQLDQVSGTCTHTYSIARPGVMPAGVGNSADDPLFVNTMSGDLHVQPQSPAHHAADPSADLTGLAARDIDGQSRTVQADIGADEVDP